MRPMRGKLPGQYYRVRPSGVYDWGWLWFGLLRRLCLWLFRVRGGFVCRFCWFAFGVGFGLPVWRWFRWSLMFVRVWCWFLSILRAWPWFWSCAVVSFHLGIIRPNVRKCRSREHRGSCRTRFREIKIGRIPALAHAKRDILN